jgi:GGDEF domain-containing protein
MTLENVFHRARDLVARCGGEEFVIILANMVSDTALQMANALCKK